MKYNTYSESRNTENVERNPKEDENARWELEENHQGIHYRLCY